MADTRTEWRAERGDERASGPDGPVAGWLDDRGVSEVIGSILVFGLLVSLLAIVQTQAVPDANNEVEVKHSDDVQGDMANLQAAITRTSAFGGTESTVVETGMTYPPRLVLYNPPAVQGTLRTSDSPSDNVEVNQFGYDIDADGDAIPVAPTDDNVGYKFIFDREFSTNLVSYEADYNRYQESPTIRYEHGTLVSDFGDETTVQAEGNLVNGRRISLTYLDGGLQESQVRPASITTYPVSAPGQTIDVPAGSQPGELVLPTSIDESVWVSEVLRDQIDTNALPGGDLSACSDLETIDSSNPASDTDGRYIIDCSYDDSTSPAELTLTFQSDTTYEMQMSKVAFQAQSDEVAPAYVTADNALANSVSEVTLEFRDRFNNPVSTGTISIADYDTGSNTVQTPPDESGVEIPTDGELTVDKPSGVKAYYIDSGPNAFTPGSGVTCFQSPACILSSNFPTSGSTSPVRLSDATIVADDQVRLTLQNFGPERSVETVKTNYVTVHEQKKVVESADLVTTTSDTLAALAQVVTDADVNVGKTNATDTIDGPNALTDIAVDPSSGTSVSGTFGTAPVENGPAVNAPDLTPIPATSNGNEVTLTFDESIEADMGNEFGDSETPSDMLEVSVTVTYSDGYRTTYTTQLHAPEDDGR
ncbi:hypothetical protein [Haloglomus litoreum]|uniref:hypothetical protein n=1 Tax=Haloglomus litoreum TaxID=3034026 RepID=UPI0023E7A757|nr:hypothetical protein [Haloglomus sp. DT116]